MNPEFEATPMHNIDNSIAHARARGSYFYDIKFIRLKENSYNSQKFCTLKITRCTVFIVGFTLSLKIEVQLCMLNVTVTCIIVIVLTYFTSFCLQLVTYFIHFPIKLAPFLL